MANALAREVSPTDLRLHAEDGVAYKKRKESVSNMLFCLSTLPRRHTAVLVESIKKGIRDADSEARVEARK